MMLPYDKTSSRQQWIAAGDKIQNRLNPKEVLRLKPGSLFCSASLVPVEIAPNDTGTLYLWLFEFIPDQIKSLRWNTTY